MPALKNKPSPAGARELPSPATASEEARLNVRLGAEQKGLIERAASYAGENLTAFTVSTLVERARKIIAEHELTVLSERDRDRFLDLLDAPPAPAASLQRAAERHAALVAHPSGR